ncbi:MAG: phosphoribosylglycinamide formyltransferase [Dissulfurispiraceae bacterium]|jgi:phosphoribosylglycinamide formyltransferase-1|nr:phosphoribosylglycinamide formyltransferase [Dissulfurispiraceae bacterium]
MLKLGVLASGRGSNFQAVIDSIESGRLKAKIELLIVDKADAYAAERAKKHSIEHIFINPKVFPLREDFFSVVRDELLRRGVELVVLTGFMRVVKKPLIDAYTNRIINIHPALLPSFPGLHGQKQALEHGVRISGCTVHFVDEGMDTGPIIIQAAVPVCSGDTEDSLSARILKQEHIILPEAIRLYSEGRLRVEGRRVLLSSPENDAGCIINPMAV